MIKDLNITSVNADKSKESVEKLGASVDKTGASIKNLNAEIKNSADAFKDLNGIINTFNKSFKDTNLTVDQVRSQLATLDAGLTKLNSSTVVAGNSSRDLGLSYRGVSADLGNTSQSLLSTSNGFRNASEVSRALGGSLQVVGTAGMVASGSMTGAASGTGLYATSATAATGATLTLEQGVSKLVDIMSKESDVLTKVNNALKIQYEVEKISAKGKGDTIDYMNKELITQKRILSLMDSTTDAYKQQEKYVWKIADQVNNLTSQYDAQVFTLNRYQSRMDAINRVQQRNTQTTNNSTESVRQNTEAVEENGRQVGNSGRAYNGFSNILGRAFKWFSAYAIVTKFFDVIKGGINTIREFTKETSRLSAITGLPKASEEMKNLENQAINLGKSTEYTSKQIVELQIELAKLGLRQREILDSTNSISAAATAMGSSLAETAKLGATTMKAYGLEATDMEQIMGALAESTTKSALSFDYLTTALPYASTAGKAMGFELEDTLALLSALADSGFKASQAGTGLRNIFSKLADETKKLGKELGPIRNLDDLLNGFEELSKAGVDLGKAFELTDARAMNQFLTLVKNRKAIKDLSNDYKETAGVLDEMREKQLNNLDGSIIKLTSAWDGLMLSFRKSDGILKGVVDYLTQFVTNLQQAFESIEDYTNRISASNLDNLYKKMETSYNDSMKSIKEGYDDQHEALKKSLDAKLITQEEYNKKVKDLEAKEAVDREKHLEAIRYREIESIKKDSIDKERELKEATEKLAKVKSEWWRGIGSQELIDDLEKQVSLLKKEISDTNALIDKAGKFRYKRQGEVAEPSKPKAEEGKSPEVDKVAEEAARIYEAQRRASIGELARLKEDYEKRKALLEQYGYSTLHLTFNYEEQVNEILKKSSEDQLKITQDQVKEKERIEKEAKRKRFDEFMSDVNDSANKEIIKWNNLLNANIAGSLEYDNAMIQINLKRLQDEYDYLSKSENQTEESEIRKTEILKEQLEERKKLNNINLEIAQAGMDALASIMGGASKLAKENSKAQKALAISEVVINTVTGGITAVKKSIDTFGMPAGPIIGGAQAAALALSGAAAIKQIKNAGKDDNVGAAAQAIAPPPISMTRNVLGQDDITLQKEIMGDISPVVKVSDIEKGLSKSRTKVQESSF